MNINLIYRHPCELEIESLLSREEPYPDTFTLADRTTERLTRARTGLVHVMNEILPSVGGEQATVITSWLQKVELEIESLLSREEPYPDTFTLADRTTERLTRARTGLVHVMNEILPSVGGEQATVITSWLQKVTSLIDISLIDAESAK